jgi:hypothetical protein
MTSTERSRLAFVWALWFVALGAAAYLAYHRYNELAGVIPTGANGAGGDFWLFLHGARQIASGHSLYGSAGVPKNSYGYVYSPLVALVLLPFSHAATVHVWHVWTALSIAALILFAGLVTLAEVPGPFSWRRPLLFGFSVVTVLEFVVTKVELSQGQTDAFVLVVLAVAVLMLERRVALGVLIGIGGLIKTWPAAAALVVFRHGVGGRLRVLVGLVPTLLVALVLAGAIGGTSGLEVFLRETFDSRSQNLISHSVWGTPLLLFSDSRLAHPVLVSTPLRDIVTVVLLIWVVTLLVISLRWNASPVLCFWNVVACVVLLVPVSHSYYTLYLLPILWIWAGRWLAAPRSGGTVLVVAGLLMLWWLVLFHINWSPIANGSPTESSLRVSVIFFANLAAVTVSVVGDRRVGTIHNERAPENPIPSRAPDRARSEVPTT